MGTVPDDKTEVLYVRIPREMKKILDNLAVDNGLTIRMVVEQIMSRGLRGAYTYPPDSIANLNRILDEMETTLNCAMDHPNLKYHGEKCEVCGFVRDGDIV